MNIPSGRSGSVQQPFKFQCGDYIREFPVSELRHPGSVEWFETGSNDDIPNLQFHGLIQLVEVDAVWDRTGFNTGPAFSGFQIDTGFFIDQVFVRDCLGERNIDGFPEAGACVEFTESGGRTFFRAGSASDSGGKVHPPCLFQDGNGVVPRDSPYIEHFTISH